MGKLCAVMSCFLLSMGAVTAQGAQTQMSNRLLPQWLTGIIAVAGFLFLTFVGFLVKKAWCEEPSRKKTTMELLGEDAYVNKNPYVNSPDMIRKLEEENEYVNENTYENSLDMVRSKDDMVIDSAEDKVTAI